MKKSCGLLASALALSLALTACGGTTDPTPTPAADPTPTPVTAAPTPTPDAADPATTPTGGDTENDGSSIQTPMIVTTCGQSPGSVMINMVAIQAGKTSENNTGLTADDLDSATYKTLVVTTGTSMKGMGAAGTDVNAEIERCVALINAAHDAGMTVVGAHVEGMARRTDSSDEASINAVMELADIILVTEDSDSDGFFTTYANDNNKPLLKVKDQLAIGEVLS